MELRISIDRQMDLWDPRIVGPAQVEPRPPENKDRVAYRTLNNFGDRGRRKETISKEKKRKFGDSFYEETGYLKRQRLLPQRQKIPRLSTKDNVPKLVIAESVTAESIITPDQEANGGDPK